ncbi:MAG: dihydrolipoyl dehydrogenase [Candidatus Omnitrophota bacterium]
MFDLTIIGAGWAGYSAALRAKELGKSVCLIEKSDIGGTCLNRGCIPTKFLVTAAKQISAFKKANSYGIEVSSYNLDFKKTIENKNGLIAKQRATMENQLKIKGIEVIKSEGRLTGPNRIKAGERVIESKYILIATGSKPFELPDLKFDRSKFISSDELLNQSSIPKTLLIVGGGVIGCEFASIFNSLGSKVTIVELLDRILPTEDKEASKKLEVTLKKKGITIHTAKKAQDLNLNDFEKVLVCVGRASNTRDLGLDELGVKINKGAICVNEYLETSIKNIYAAGDCIAGYQLAHVAAYEGKLSVDNMFGQKQKADYSSVPSAIFTEPEIASVGIDEDEAKAKNIEIKVAKFSFLGLGLAHITGATDGFIKIIAAKHTEEILGAVIFGQSATELIGSLSLAIRNKLTISQIKNTIFPHPTISESILEAVLRTQ